MNYYGFLCTTWFSFDLALSAQIYQKNPKPSFTFFKINAYAPPGEMQDLSHWAWHKGKILKDAVSLQNSNCSFKQRM